MKGSLAAAEVSLPFPGNDRIFRRFPAPFSNPSFGLVCVTPNRNFFVEVVATFAAYWSKQFTPGKLLVNVRGLGKD